MVVPTHEAAKSPHMVVFATAAALSAIIQIMIGEQPPSLEATVSPAIATSWSLLCALGGVSVVVGTYWRDAATGLLIEATGHFALGVGYLAYCIALRYHLDGTWYASATFWWSMGFVLASAIRWWMIHRVIHKAKKRVAEMERRSRGN